METFIVRVWAPSPDLVDEIPEDELHGSVDHLRARESYRFRTGAGLIEILRLALEPPRGGLAGEGAKPPSSTD